MTKNKRSLPRSIDMVEPMSFWPCKVKPQPSMKSRTRLIIEQKEG